MARKRERFERTDVPSESPYKNIIGIVVVVVVFGALAILVNSVWNRVQLESNLGDSDLSDTVDGLSAVYTPDGYTASTDELEVVLLFTADGLDTGSGLSAARILVVNQTQNTAIIASVPTNVRVTYDGTKYTLAELYAASGYAACVDPLSDVTDVVFDHVIVSTNDVVESVAALTGTSSSNLVSTASSLIKTIKTDMSASEVVELADLLSLVGTSNISSTEASLYNETAQDEEGNTYETGYYALDSTTLVIQLGLYVSSATE